MSEQTNYCDLCHTTPHIPDDMKYHPECEESYNSPDLKEIWGRINLSYFKQGDDLNSAIQKVDGVIDLGATFRTHYRWIQQAANTLDTIATYFERHPEIAKKCDLDADTHFIRLSGPPDAMRELIGTGTVNFDGPYLRRDPDGGVWKNFQSYEL